jgi:hypothetical protein
MKVAEIVSFGNIIIGFLGWVIGVILCDYKLLISCIYPFITGIGLATFIYIDKKHKELLKELEKLKY